MQAGVRALYRRLLGFYPLSFRERMGESMQQSFNDLCNERKREAGRSYPIYLIWIFIETTAGIIGERISQFKEASRMKGLFRNLGMAAITSLLLILPLMLMEWVNRRSFRAAGSEDFPSPLFIFLWLSLFALALILLPVLRSLRTGRSGAANSLPAQQDTLLTAPRRAAMISLGLLLPFVIVGVLDSLGVRPLDRLFNGPDPSQTYLPGLFLALVFLSLPVAAAVIARQPIVGTLQAGGSLFAHPVNLVIVVLVVSVIMMSLGSWISDQWPCFLGVPSCD